MKHFASTFSIIGVASGALFALAPWVLGSGNASPASFVFPLILGVLVMATHWFTFRRIHAGSGTRVGLLIPNALLLVVILLGFLYTPPNPATGDRPVLRLALLATVFLLPLACNVLYLAFRGRPPETLPQGS